jgi:hypothetical protein
MTDTLEQIPTMTPVEHLAEVLRREDSTEWEKCDAVAEAVDDQAEREGRRRPGDVDPDPSGRTGLSRLVEKVWGELFDADIPEQPAIKTVSRWYAMAEAWPAETRVTGASYAAHRLLAPAKYRHRQGTLSKLVDKSGKRRVSEADVRNWIAEQNKQKPDPWQVRFERRVFAPLNSRLAGPVTESDWRSARDSYQLALGRIDEKLAEF